MREETSVQANFDVSGRRLTATVTGDYDAEESVSKFASVLLYCRTYPIDEVLIDFRQLSGIGFITSEIMYAYHIAKLYRQYIVDGGQPFRLAYLGPHTYINRWMPGLGVVRAGGLQVIATTELPEAMEWLACSGDRVN